MVNTHKQLKLSSHKSDFIAPSLWTNVKSRIVYIHFGILCPGELTSDRNDLQGNDQTARLI